MLQNFRWVPLKTVCKKFPLFIKTYFSLYRYGCFEALVQGIEEHEGGLDKFTKGYDYFGINLTEDGGVVCREWAPAAKAVYLRGDFSEFS